MHTGAKQRKHVLEKVLWKLAVAPDAGLATAPCGKASEVEQTSENGRKITVIIKTVC